MTKDVLVTISGLQFMPEGKEPPEPVEVTCPGTYYTKNGEAAAGFPGYHEARRQQRTYGL